MRYAKIDSFEKHLEEALPDHPSPIYFIFMEDPFDRRYLAEKIISKLSLPVTQCTDETLLEELESLSLFDEKRIFLCDEVTLKMLPLGKESLPILTGKTPPPCFKKFEKEGVTLDLRGEKPWDKKSRLERWLLEHVRKKKKTLAKDAAAYLTQFSYENFATLSQEVEKALIFAGEETQVTREMVQAICHFSPDQNGWELSEAVVWGGPVIFGEIDLYGLVGQLRYQLQLGLQTVTGKNPPRISSKKLDKIQKSPLDQTFYLEGLQELFRLEMKMRSSISNQMLLFDHFRAKLAARRHALSIA